MSDVTFLDQIYTYVMMECIYLCNKKVTSSPIDGEVAFPPSEARRETFTTPKLVTTRQSILGPPAEGRPGPSKVKISVCNCRQSRSVSGRHGWLTEVNGRTGGSPDNLNSLIILSVGIVVAIITYICVLHIQVMEQKSCSWKSLLLGK